MVVESSQRDWRSLPFRHSYLAHLRSSSEEQRKQQEPKNQGSREIQKKKKNH